MWETFLEALEVLGRARPFLLKWVAPVLVMVLSTSLLTRGLIGRRRVLCGRCERCGYPRPGDSTASQCTECGMVPARMDNRAAVRRLLLPGSWRVSAKVFGGGLAVVAVTAGLAVQFRINRFDRFDWTRVVFVASIVGTIWMAARVLKPRTGRRQRWSRLAFALAALVLGMPALLVARHLASTSTREVVTRRSVAAAYLGETFLLRPERSPAATTTHAAADLLLRSLSRDWHDRASRTQLLFQPVVWTPVHDARLDSVTEFETFFARAPMPHEIRACTAMTGLRSIHFWRLPDDAATLAALEHLGHTHVVSGTLRDASDAPVATVRIENGQTTVERRRP